MSLHALSHALSQLAGRPSPSLPPLSWPVHAFFSSNLSCASSSLPPASNVLHLPSSLRQAGLGCASQELTVRDGLNQPLHALSLTGPERSRLRSFSPSVSDAPFSATSSWLADHLVADKVLELVG